MRDLPHKTCSKIAKAHFEFKAHEEHYFVCEIFCPYLCKFPWRAWFGEMRKFEKCASCRKMQVMGKELVLKMREFFENVQVLEK